MALNVDSDLSRFDAMSKKYFDGVTYQKSVTHNVTFISADQMSREARPADYLIKNILESGSMGILAGSSMAFKSFMALAMAHSICNGVPFMGNKCYAAQKVIYICGEGHGALSRRMRAIDLVYGGFNDNLMVLHGSLRVDNAQELKNIAQEISAISPALIILDTFSSLASGVNENDNSEVADTLAMIKRALCIGKTSVLIVHHYGKDEDKGLRGASSFLNNSDFIMTMKRDSEEDMKTTLKCKKMKDGDDFGDIHCEAEIVPLGIYDDDNDESTSLVLRHNTSILAGAKRMKSHDVFIDIYKNLLDQEPIETDIGTGVSKHKFHKIAENKLGLTGPNLRMAIKRFRDSCSGINIINDVYVIDL